MFKIALICGGPSPERGISLNSARSVLDHLSSDAVQILPLYVDQKRDFYAISTAQLYSNTPGDFDFKLAQTPTAAADFLREADLVFPVIHGAFGEDGELQTYLESLNVPFVGPSSLSCQKMYDKYAVKCILQQHGFPVLQSRLITPGAPVVCEGKSVVKPTRGGSSLGVFVVENSGEALEKCDFLFKQGHRELLLEPFCQGREFTVMVFENQGVPVALIPTEIELRGGEVLDYRRKYLATNQVIYHTPATFSLEVIQEIRRQAEALFPLFQMRDFVRLDGFLMPDGTIYFTDINPLSGLEQNSFLFRQASLLGLTHAEALHLVVKSACRRYGIECPPLPAKKGENLEQVFVLFGGSSAERQVSLMSGTNVWLKLLRSSLYHPIPFFYDFEGTVWELPYSYTLDHSVEEVNENCRKAKECPLIPEIQRALGVEVQPSLPKRHTMEQFLERAEQAFVFIAMHGGVGENGTLQALFEKHGIAFNGSDAAASALCMDKYLAGEKAGVFSLPKIALKGSWEELTAALGSQRLIVKPRCDGCSAGIVLLQSEADLNRYLSFLGEPFIPPHSFANQSEAVEMPAGGEFIVEPYIEVDPIAICGHQLLHTSKQGWVELTVGVLEGQALSPSITIAEGAVLSLEEKFQGGTGVNLTPPPEEILSAEAIGRIKQQVEEIAALLNIRNYARIDIFYNRLTDKLIFIEANTLPGLTPSTVFYHQGLAEGLAPLPLLEKIICNAKRHALTLNFTF